MRTIVIIAHIGAINNKLNIWNRRKCQGEECKGGPRYRWEGLEKEFRGGSRWRREDIETETKGEKKNRWEDLE